MLEQNTVPGWVALDGSNTNLKINLRTDHYGFAKPHSVLPIAQSEFELACKNYPIVFIAASSDATVLQSVVLLAVKPETNVFVEDDGSWAPYCYIPASVKRHPFQLGVDANQQPLVYVTEDYPGLNQTEGLALFEGTEPSAYLTQLLHALRTLQVELEQTQHWVMRLKEKGLLIERAITLSLDDKTDQLAGIWVVDTDKVAQLSDDELAQMYHNRTLALIEQHRLSLLNLDQLVQRTTA